MTKPSKKTEELFKEYEALFQDLRYRENSDVDRTSRKEDDLEDAFSSDECEEWCQEVIDTRYPSYQGRYDIDKLIGYHEAGINLLNKCKSILKSMIRTMIWIGLVLTGIAMGCYLIYVLFAFLVETMPWLVVLLAVSLFLGIFDFSADDFLDALCCAMAFGIFIDWMDGDDYY